MNDGGLNDTVNSLRRIATAGAVAAVVLLIGAVVLMALSLLFQVAQFSPFGLWSVLGVAGVAVLVAALVWLRGPEGLASPIGRRQRTLATDVVMRAPPPVPVRPVRQAAPPTREAGRLGTEAALNRMIEERRFDEALVRLAELEAADPAMATFCAAKRRAVARRQARPRRSG